MIPRSLNVVFSRASHSTEGQPSAKTTKQDFRAAAFANDSLSSYEKSTVGKFLLWLADLLGSGAISLGRAYGNDRLASQNYDFFVKNAVNFKACLQSVQRQQRHIERDGAPELPSNSPTAIKLGNGLQFWVRRGESGKVRIEVTDANKVELGSWDSDLTVEEMLRNLNERIVQCGDDFDSEFVLQCKADYQAYDRAQSDRLRKSATQAQITALQKLADSNEDSAAALRRRLGLEIGQELELAGMKASQIEIEKAKGTGPLSPAASKFEEMQQSLDSAEKCLQLSKKAQVPKEKDELARNARDLTNKARKLRAEIRDETIAKGLDHFTKAHKTTSQGAQAVESMAHNIARLDQLGGRQDSLAESVVLETNIRKQKTMADLAIADCVQYFKGSADDLRKKAQAQKTAETEAGLHAKEQVRLAEQSRKGAEESTAKITKLRATIERNKQEIQRQMGKVSHIFAEITEIQENCFKENPTAKRGSPLPDYLSSQINTLEREISKLQTKAGELSQQNEKLSGELANEQKAANHLNGELLDYQKTAREFGVKEQAAKREAERLGKDADNIDGRVAMLERFKESSTTDQATCKVIATLMNKASEAFGKTAFVYREAIKYQKAADRSRERALQMDKQSAVRNPLAEIGAIDKDGHDTLVRVLQYQSKQPYFSDGAPPRPSGVSFTAADGSTFLLIVEHNRKNGKESIAITNPSTRESYTFQGTPAELEKILNEPVLFRDTPPPTAVPNRFAYRAKLQSLGLSLNNQSLWTALQTLMPMTPSPDEPTIAVSFTIDDPKIPGKKLRVDISYESHTADGGAPAMTVLVVDPKDPRYPGAASVRFEGTRPSDLLAALPRS